jgi:hypothetical protein
MKVKDRLCIYVKISLGNKSRILELCGGGVCDITGVTNKDYYTIDLLF